MYIRYKAKGVLARVDVPGGTLGAGTPLGS